MDANPVDSIPKSKAKAKRPRRAFTEDEFLRLLQVAKDRRAIYLIAGLSGLRRNELRFLERRDVDLSGQKPLWKLRPDLAKSKRLDIIPMLPEAAEAIRPLWESATSATSRIFPTWPRRMTFERDVKRAEILKIDEEGRSLDFHSLRYFFCTMLGRRLPIQIVKMLMRHKDIRTTCNLYMNLGITDMIEGVGSLPRLLNEEQKPQH